MSYSKCHGFVARVPILQLLLSFVLLVGERSWVHLHVLTCGQFQSSLLNVPLPTQFCAIFKSILSYDACTPPSFCHTCPRSFRCCPFPLYSPRVCFGPSKLAYQLIRSSALLTWHIGIRVTQLLHVVLNQRRPIAGMGQFAARILMRAAADRKKKRTGNALIMKLKVVNFGDIL